MIDLKAYKFDPLWMIEVIEKALGVAPSIEEHPEIISFLKVELLKCKLLHTKLNADGYENNVNFYFIDSKKPNQPGSAWQFKNNIKIFHGTADLTFDIMKNDSIGAVEVWYHTRS